MKPSNKLLLVVGASIMLVINPMSSFAQGKKTSKISTSATTKVCNDKIKAWEIKAANLDPHKIKYDILGSSANISKFELCKCKDKSIVIREKDCKGAMIETYEVLP